MTTTVEDLRAELERQRGRTLPVRIAAIDKASGDLVNILERLAETIADPAALAANRQAVVSNIEQAKGHARSIREALA
jgi:hypothetical protein